MADYKKLIKNKNYLNHKSMNGLQLLIYIMVLMFVQHSNAQETGSSNISCEHKLTCTKCTITTQCVWSLNQQACVSNNHGFNNSSLMVKSEDQCPRFSVSTKRYHNKESSVLKYSVKVLNNSVAFIDFLNKTNFTCNSSTNNVSTSAIENNEIICSIQINQSYFKKNSVQSLTAFIYVKFNGVKLQLDNIADHYATIYERSCPEDDKDKYCTTCTWNDDGFAHYVRLCSSKNTCEGRNEVYMRHNGIGQFGNFTFQKVKDRCAEINVISVDPLFGSLANATNINITVKNHSIFADKRTVNIIVAGRVCKNLRGKADTITCTVTQPPDDTYDEPPSGPVLVKYISDKSELNVESSQIFQFNVGTTCGTPRPVLSSNQELYGVKSGGSNVTLKGSRFIKPCVASPARMFVKLPNGTMQFASKNCDTPDNDKYIVCRAPELNINNDLYVNSTNSTQLLNFGLEVMKFDGNRSLLVNGSLISYYHVLDDFQLMEFELKSDGSVAVYGNNLQKMHPDVLIEFQNSKNMKCNVTLVNEHSFSCMPNASIITSKVMIVKIAGFLKYEVPRRPFNMTKLIWFIVILLTIVVSVLAFMYLYNRRSNVHKTVHDHHPMTLMDLDTRTALL